MQVFNDFEKSEPLEQNHIKQTVIDGSLFKKRKRSAVETTVANKHKRSFPYWRVLRLNGQFRRLARCDVCGGDKITEWAKTALKREGGFFDGLRIKPNAAQLHEVPSIRTW